LNPLLTSPLPPQRIRNFSIIAHVDHGKSTLSDRILELVGALGKEHPEQYLDRLPLERERGITIKAQAVRLAYTHPITGESYRLHLIDTPGHVDFHYEVSRSLSACEGAILLVDATQGVEAQTVSHAYLAVNLGLELIPAINKIDLKNADPDRVLREIEEVLGIETDSALKISAKTGEGVADLLQRIVERIPPPRGRKDLPLKALIFDSWFDPYRGAILLIRVVEGSLRTGEKIRLFSRGTGYTVQEIGTFAPEPMTISELGPGDVGFIIAGIKSIHEVEIGDTIVSATDPSPTALPGFRPAKPMVFAGLYPVDTDDYEALREAMEKLHLNDSSFHFEPETSRALGFGFRCGFLGALHMEIVKERLEREFGLDLIITAPTVVYRVITTRGEELEIHNPSDLPDPSRIREILEPYLKATIYTPEAYLGAVIKLCQEKRGVQTAMNYLGPGRVMLEYELPFSEIVLDFFDRLKSITRGYGSLDYQILGYRPGDLVKMTILVASEPVDALSLIVPRIEAYSRGREIVQRLLKLIPRQLFEVPIQAALYGRVIARETIPPLRKNVTAKCYGGDVTRKRKLLERQKEGKKRMKMIGHVEIPKEAFIEVLKIERNSS
jgi:GTP-binding protein LepA